MPISTYDTPQFNATPLPPEETNRMGSLAKEIKIHLMSDAAHTVIYPQGSIREGIQTFAIIDSGDTNIALIAHTVGPYNTIRAVWIDGETKIPGQIFLSENPDSHPRKFKMDGHKSTKPCDDEEMAKWKNGGTLDYEPVKKLTSILPVDIDKLTGRLRIGKKNDSLTQTLALLKKKWGASEVVDYPRTPNMQ